MQRRRSDVGRQCGNAWSGLENQSQEIGSERKSKKKKVQMEGLIIKKNKAFQKSCMKVGVKEELQAGTLGACMLWGWLARKD